MKAVCAVLLFALIATSMAGYLRYGYPGYYGNYYGGLYAGRGLYGVGLAAPYGLGVGHYGYGAVGYGLGVGHYGYGLAGSPYLIKK